MTDNRVAPRAGAMRHVAGTAHLLRGARTAHLLHGVGTALLQSVAGSALLLRRARTARLLHGAGTALLATGLVLAGCSQRAAGPAGSRLRVYAADLAGAAKVCDVPKVNPAVGAGSEAPMKVVNDGGWCAISVHQDGPKPYEAGLLTTRPNHGNVLIHEVGDDTRIDYTPDRGFVGSDSFSVQLIPGNASIRVPVTVTLPTPPKA
jgi:hypothetical protein